MHRNQISKILVLAVLLTNGLRMLQAGNTDPPPPDKPKKPPLPAFLDPTKSTTDGPYLQYTQLPPDTANVPAKVVYGQLPNLSTAQQANFNQSEKALANMGFNVQKLRELSPDSVLDIQGFKLAINNTGRRADTISFYTAKGVLAIPDDNSDAALSRMCKTTDGQNNRTPGSQLPDLMKVGDPSALATFTTVANYLNVNRELEQIRSQVLDTSDPNNNNTNRKSAVSTLYAASQKSLDPANRNNLDVAKEFSQAAIAAQITLGLNRLPSADEGIGLGVWQQYFQGRENRNGVGERDVGAMLDAPEIRIAADLLRFGGSNKHADLTPASRTNTTDANFGKEPVGNGNQVSKPHTWRDAAPSVIKELRGTDADPLKERNNDQWQRERERNPPRNDPRDPNSGGGKINETQRPTE